MFFYNEINFLCKILLNKKNSLFFDKSNRKTNKEHICNAFTPQDVEQVIQN